MMRFSGKFLILILLFWGPDGRTTVDDRPKAPVKVLLSENRLDEAEAICSQYQVLSTRDKEDMLACAWVYLRTLKIPAAEKILEEQKSNFKSVDYQLLRGYLLGTQKKYDEAKKIFETIASENKGKAIALTAQELTAEIYDMQERLPTAGFIYNMVLKEDPSRGKSAWGLARFYQSQNDLQRSLKYLELTTKLWPRHIPSRFLLAKIYLSMGPEYLSEGFNWLKESYRFNKSNPEVLEEIGSFFEKKNKIPQAVKYWQKALTIKPDLVLAGEKVKEYFTQTIQELFDSEKYEEVIVKLSENKTLSETVEMVLIRGQSYRNVGQYEKAIADLRLFLKTNPKSSLANREVGIAYLNIKSWDLAAEAFSKAVINEPANGLNFGWFAFALEEKGDLVRAKEYWEKALQLLDEPTEIEKANRKIASIEKRIKKRSNQAEEIE